MPRHYRRNPEVLFSQAGDDIVALAVGAGHCFAMEDVTAETWKLLDEPRTIDALCVELQRLFDVDAATCRSDLAELMDRMLQEKLVVQV